MKLFPMRLEQQLRTRAQYPLSHEQYILIKSVFNEEQIRSIVDEDPTYTALCLDIGVGPKRDDNTIYSTAVFTFNALIAKAILQLLYSSKRIGHLILRQWRLSLEILTLVAAHNILTCLNVSRCHVDDEGISIIAKMHSLIKLIASYNKIGDPGAISIGENTLLQVVDLSNNNITDLGMIGLSQSKSIINLQVQDNFCGDLGTIALAKNSVLRILSIGLIDNYSYRRDFEYKIDIGSDGIEALAALSSITSLKLYLCHSSDEKKPGIYNAFKKFKQNLNLIHFERFPKIQEFEKASYAVRHFHPQLQINIPQHIHPQSKETKNLEKALQKRIELNQTFYSLYGFAVVFNQLAKQMLDTMNPGAGCLANDVLFIIFSTLIEADDLNGKMKRSILKLNSACRAIYNNNERPSELPFMRMVWERSRRFIAPEKERAQRKSLTTIIDKHTEENLKKGITARQSFSAEQLFSPINTEFALVPPFLKSTTATSQSLLAKFKFTPTCQKELQQEALSDWATSRNSQITANRKRAHSSESITTNKKRAVDDCLQLSFEAISDELDTGNVILR